MNLIRRSARVAVLAVLGGTVAFTGATSASLGDVDRSFGMDGQVSFGKPRSEGVDVVIFPDGRTVTMTAFYGATENDPLEINLWSRLPDGSVDAEWGGDGMVRIARRTTIFPVSIERAADGGVLVGADIRRAGPDKSTLLKYRRDGTLDRAFSSDGKLTFGSRSQVRSCGDIAVDREGSVSTGLLQHRGGRMFSVVRMTANGKPDRQFGVDGVVNLGHTAGCADVRLGPGGSLTAIGYTRSGSGRFGCRVFRLTRTGDPDLSFSGDGITELPNGACALSSITSEGGLVLSGTVRNDDDEFIYVVQRVNPDGEIDPEFGNEGTVRIGQAQMPYVTDVAVGPDDAIYVAGSQYFNQTGWDIALARFTPSGKPDRRFAEDGLATSGTPGSNERHIWDFGSGLAVGKHGDAAVAAQVVVVHCCEHGSLFKFEGDN